MALQIGQSLTTATNALARQSRLNYTASVGSGSVSGSLASVLDGGPGASAEGAAGSFESAMLKALEGVDAYQAKSDDLLQQMIVDPDSVDAQDVTIAMAEANLSLNLAKTILSRVVTAWKDVINTR